MKAFEYAAETVCERYFGKAEQFFARWKLMAGREVRFGGMAR